MALKSPALPGAPLGRACGEHCGRLGARGVAQASQGMGAGAGLWGSVRDATSLGCPLQNPHRRQTLQVPTSWLRKGFHSAFQPPGECPPAPKGACEGGGTGGALPAPDPPLCPLQSHQRQHNKDKPYKCPNCYRAYSDSASLQIHLSAHAIKHAKAYCCSMCGRAYTSVSAWGPRGAPPPRRSVRSPHFPDQKAEAQRGGGTPQDHSAWPSQGFCLPVLFLAASG